MKILLNVPHLEGNEKKYLAEVIDSTWLTRGEFNERFEREFADFCGVKHALSISSGTAAEQVLIMAAGLKGKKVAVPAYTCMSVAEAVVHAGAIPVLTDIEIDTLGIDYDSLVRMHQRTGFEAVLINHLYGFIARDTAKIADWCQETGTILLEDACEAHGATCDLGTAGSIGLGAVFSIRSEKMIGVGEGGVIVTDSERLWENAYYWINSARPSSKVRYWVTGEGWNLFMPNALAAIGLAQIEQAHKIIAKKRSIGKWYEQEFAKRPYLTPQKSLWCDPVYWLNTAILGDSIKLIREDLITMFTECEIETRPGFYPLNVLPPYCHYDSDDTPVSDLVGRRLICFPSNAYMTKEQVTLVFEKLDKFLGVS